MSRSCETSVRRSFQQWKKLHADVDKWMRLEPQKLELLWTGGVLSKDDACHHRDYDRYPSNFAYVCSTCKEIDHMTDFGLVKPDTPFDGECLPSGYTLTWILESFPRHTPKVEVVGRTVYADKVTKEWLLTHWLENRLYYHEIPGAYTPNVIREPILFQCNSTTYLLKEHDYEPVQTDDKIGELSVKGLLYQLLWMYQHLNGFVHGRPFLDSLVEVNKDWERVDKKQRINVSFSFALAFVDLDASYVFRAKESEVAILPLKRPRVMWDEEEIEVEYENEKATSWIRLTPELLEASLVQHRLYIPSMEYYAFLFSAMSYVNLYDVLFYSSGLKGWLEQLFDEESIERITKRFQTRFQDGKGPIQRISETVELMEGIKIHPVLDTIRFPY